MMNFTDVFFPFLTFLLNTLAVHTLLTRKRSISYCFLAFICNTLFILGVEFLILSNFNHPVVAKSIFFFIGFFYFIYIYFVFQEPVSKKLFAMSSVWLFSLSLLLVSMILIGLLPGFIEAKDISVLIHVTRNGLQILLLSVLYFKLGKPYNRVLGLVPGRTTAFMSLYPITAFILLIIQSPDTIYGFQYRNIIFDLLFLEAFIIIGYLIVFTGISASSKLEVQNYMANYGAILILSGDMAEMSLLSYNMRSKRKAMPSY